MQNRLTERTLQYGLQHCSCDYSAFKRWLFAAWHLILQRRHLCSFMHNDEAPPVEPNSHSASIPECSTLLRSDEPWKDRLQMKRTFHSQQPLVLMLPRVQHCYSIWGKWHAFYYYYYFIIIINSLEKLWYTLCYHFKEGLYMHVSI